MNALPTHPTERDRERFRDLTKAMQFGLEYDRRLASNGDYTDPQTVAMFRLWWPVERERQLLQNLNMSQGCKLSELAQKLGKAEAELESLRWQKPVATLVLSYDGADFEMYYDNNKLRFEGMSMKLYAAAGAAPAALEMLRDILNTADAKRIFDKLSFGQGIGTDDGRTWLSARAMLQAIEVTK